MSNRGRYAPTPSGPLHVGNLRTALLAWLWTRRTGGAFVLRMEDLDWPRVRRGAAQAILDDLRWLGLDWDEGPDVGGPYAPYTQSERRALYEMHLRQLERDGLVYPCYCSRRDIAEAVRAPHGPSDEEPRYRGTCRDPARRAEAKRCAAGRPPALRFRVPTGTVQFEDAIHGHVEQDVAESVGDFVVCRSDGTPAYHLAVVVDDALMRITEVVRGDDLLLSTPRQILLYRAFGYDPPSCVHVPLAVDAAGERLAKRDGAVGLAPLRDRGMAPEQVVGMLAASAGLVSDGMALSAQALLKVSTWDTLRRQPSSIALHGS